MARCAEASERLKALIGPVGGVKRPATDGSNNRGPPSKVII